VGGHLIRPIIVDAEEFAKKVTAGLKGGVDSVPYDLVLFRREKEETVCGDDEIVLPVRERGVLKKAMVSSDL